MFLMGGHSCQQYQQSFVPESSDVFMKPNLEEFWKLETIGIKDPINDCDDDQALKTSTTLLGRQMGDTKLLGHGKKQILDFPTTTNWLLVG